MIIHFALVFGAPCPTEEKCILRWLPCYLPRQVVHSAPYDVLVKFSSFSPIDDPCQDQRMFVEADEELQPGMEYHHLPYCASLRRPEGKGEGVQK